MRRMYSEKQLKKKIEEYAVQPEEVVGALVGKDINVNGITSKGIANTGGLANIGDVAISGDLIVQGEGKGKIVGNTLEQRMANKVFEVDVSAITTGLVIDAHSFMASKVINGVLWIIIEAVLNNPTENSLAIGTFSTTVDEETGSRIYLKNGETINDYTGSEHQITASSCLLGSSVSTATLTCYLKNRLQFYFGTTISAGQSKSVSVRIPLILL